MFPAFIGGFGPFELGIILVVLVFLFGASKIPDLARASGLAIGEFEKGREQVEQELEEMRNDTPDESDEKDSESDPGVEIKE